MSSTYLRNFEVRNHQQWARVLGDVLDLSPQDARISATYAVGSAPGGSTATFSGATFQPDLVGAYSLTVTVGADVLTVKVFVFDLTNAYNKLKPSNPADVAYSDPEKRQILQALIDNNPASTFTTWNATGILPPLRLGDFGAR